MEHRISMFGLQQSEIAQIREILGKYPAVTSAILWGSRAKGDFSPSSDIDFVLFGDDVTVPIMNEIAWELDDLLLPYTFDLSIYHLISKPSVLRSITNYGIELYKQRSMS